MFSSVKIYHNVYKTLNYTIIYVHYVLEHKLCASVQNSVIQKVDNYA